MEKAQIRAAHYPMVEYFIKGNTSTRVSAFGLGGFVLLTPTFRDDVGLGEV